MVLTKTTVIRAKQVRMDISSSFDGFEFRFELTAFGKDEFKVGIDVVIIPALQIKYPYLASFKPNV